MRNGFQEAYRALAGEYEGVSEILTAQARAGLTQEAAASLKGKSKSDEPRLDKMRMLTLVQHREPLALEISCSNDELAVVLDDGRTISVPLAWFPRLLQASAKQRKEWELIGGGIGVHWEAIDEDISVASLLQPEKFIR